MAKKSRRIRSLQTEVTGLQQQLEKSEQRFTDNTLTLHEYIRAVDASSIVLKLHTDNTISYVNERFCQLTGLPPEKLINQPFCDLLHPNVPESTKQLIKNLLLQGEEWHGVLEFGGQDGSSLFLDSTLIGIIAEDNTISEFLLIARDVSALILKEKEVDELRNQEMLHNIHQARTLKLEEVIDAIPIPALILDSKGIIFHANTHFLDLFDFLEDQDKIGQIHSQTVSLPDLLSFEEDDPLGRKAVGWIEHVVSFGEEETLEVSIRDTNQPRLYQLSVCPIDAMGGLYLASLLPLEA